MPVHAAPALSGAGRRLVLQQQRPAGVPVDPRAEAAQHRGVPSPCQSRLQGVRRQRDHAQVNRGQHAFKAPLLEDASGKTPEREKQICGGWFMSGENIGTQNG